MLVFGTSRRLAQDRRARRVSGIPCNGLVNLYNKDGYLYT